MSPSNDSRWDTEERARESRIMCIFCASPPLGDVEVSDPFREIDSTILRLIS